MAEPETARKRYLRAAISQYGVAHLPAPDEDVTVALEPIYQPLRLRTSPLVAGAERRAVDAPDEAPPADVEYGDPRKAAQVAAHAEEALARSPEGRIVILGGPGTGKTTTLQRLATVVARRALADSAGLMPLPLYLTLPALAASGLSLEDAAASGAIALLDANPGGVTQAQRDDVARLALAAAERRAAIFLLDGLDEVEPARRADMIARLNAWAAQPGGVWIIGSRFTEYKGGQFRSGGYSEWELLPLDRAAKLELARRLLPALSRTRHSPDASAPAVPHERLSPTALVDTLEERPQTRPWAENPLLLSLAALVYARAGALPARRAGLYDAVVEAALAAHEPDTSRRADLRRRLAQAALHLFQRRGRSFTRVEVLSALARPEPPLPDDEAARALWQVARAGLIEAPSVGSCAFRHLTVQEYLVGEALADGLTTDSETERTGVWDLAWSKRLYSRWSEPLRLMTGALGLRVDTGVESEARSGPAQALRWTQSLLAQRDTAEGDPGGLGFALAARCVVELPDTLAGDSEDALVETQRAVLAAWLSASRRGLMGSNNALANRAGEVAADVGALPATLVGPIVDELIAESRERITAEGGVSFDLVISLRSPHALAGVRALVWDANINVAKAAITCLGSARALPNELFEELLADPVRREIASWQAKSASLPTASLLPWMSDPTPSVRANIVHALAKTGDPAALPAIITALRDDNPQVRQHAVLALGKIGDLAPLEPLVAALDDSYHYVRDSARHVLLGQGKRAPETILWRIARESNETHRADALKLLACAGSQTAREQLIAARDNLPALLAIGGIPDPPLDVFLDVLSDIGAGSATNWPRMSGAARQLLRLAPERAIPALVTILHNDAVAFRRRLAASHLLAAGASEIVEGALGSLRDSSPRARTLAITLLAQDVIESGREESLDGLRASLASAEPQIREEAIRACASLAERGSTFPTDVIVSIIRDERVTGNARIAAVDLLNAQHGTLSEGQWLEMLASDHRQATQCAMKSQAPEGVAIPDATVTRLLKLYCGNASIFPLSDMARTLTHARRKTLWALLQSQPTVERAVATVTLRMVGESVPLEWLVEAAWVAGPGKAITPAVIRLLGAEFSVETLRELARYANVPLVSQALDMLQERDPDMGAVAALQVYETGDQIVKSTALKALWSRGRVEALEPILGAIELAKTPIETLGHAYGLLALLKARPDLASRVSERVALHARAMSQHRNETVRLVGARLLQRLGRPFDRAPFFELLDLSDAEGYETEINAHSDGILRLLAETGEPLSVEFLRAALRHSTTTVRALAVTLLADRPEAALPEVVAQIASLLADEGGEDKESVASNAYSALRRLAPAINEEAVAQARALLMGSDLGPIFQSAADIELADALSLFGNLTPGLYAWLEQALASPDWRVRAAAVSVFEQHHRNVPDAIIRRLYALRHDPESACIRNFADKALASILSLETGMEDE